jgi:hypothetical protein
MAYDSVFVKTFLSTARDSENRRTSVGSAIFAGRDTIFPPLRKADRSG